MTAYGYRLFTIQAFKGRSRTNLDFSDFTESGRSGGAFINLLEDLRDFRRGGVQVGSPRYWNTAEDAEAEAAIPPVGKLQPYLELTTSSRRGTQRIDASARYGREGDYDYLLARDPADAQSMKGKAPVRSYRLWFVLPQHGTTGFLIAETKGRSHAAEALIHTLRCRNQHTEVEFTDNGKDEGQFVRWDIAPIFDEARIDDLLVESTDHKVTLRRHAIDGASDRHEGPLVLTKQGIPHGQMDHLKDLFKEWWRSRTRNKQELRQEAADDLSAIVGESDALNGLGFNDGEVSFVTKGKTLTVSPDSIEKLYVYQIGERLPTDDEVLSDAFGILERMRAPLQVEVDLQ